MVERRRELNARYTRKRKMLKLKAKLQAPGADRDKILGQIRRVSPWWTEAALAQAAAERPDMTGGAPAAEEAKKKAPAAPPPRPKKA